MIKKLISKNIFLATTFLLLTFIFYFPFRLKPTIQENSNISIVTHIDSNTSITPPASLPIEITSKPTNIVTIPIADAAPVEIGKPIRLTIPSINVNAFIESIGLTKEGAVGVPDGARNVSWFNSGPRPGQQGSAVISGHYGRWKNGIDSVFNLLPNLNIGEKIYVKDDKGNMRSFTVRSTKVYSKDETVPEIFNKTDNAYLNIITCHGTYLESQHTYSQRLVIFAQLD